MGLSAKPIGKLEGMLRKVKNEQEKEQKLLNKSKSKENKKS